MILLLFMIQCDDQVVIDFVCYFLSVVRLDKNNISSVTQNDTIGCLNVEWNIKSNVQSNELRLPSLVSVERVARG